MDRYQISSCGQFEVSSSAAGNIRCLRGTRRTAVNPSSGLRQILMRKQGFESRKSDGDPIRSFNLERGRRQEPCGYRPFIPGEVIVCPCCIRSLLFVFVEIVAASVVALLLFPRHELRISLLVDTDFLFRLPDLIFVVILNFLHDGHHITVGGAGSH